MRPLPRLAAPAASTPISRTSGSSRKPANIPIAFEPAADAGHDGLGQAALRREHLLPRLPADHRLEVAHELGVRMRAGTGADQVVRRLDVRDPVADRLAHRLLEGSRAELDGTKLGAEQPHPLDVGTLPADVLRTHVDDAGQPEAGADGRGGDAVLPGSGLGDHPRLAEPPREEHLAERVVDLVRAGVAEILALEVDALARRQPFGKGQGRGPPGVVRCSSSSSRQKPRPLSPRPSPARAPPAPERASPGRSGRRRARSSMCPAPPRRTRSPSPDP